VIAVSYDNEQGANARGWRLDAAPTIPRALAAAGLAPGDHVTVRDSISGTWTGTVTGGDFVNDLIGVNPDRGGPCRYRFASEITRNDADTDDADRW
jgi:hypothetical protein